MNKAGILKISGLIVVPILVLVIVMYFLYPYINKEKYEQIVDEVENGVMASDSLKGLEDDTTAFTDSVFIANFTKDSLTTDSLVMPDTLGIGKHLKLMEKENERLLALVDSLNNRTADLEQQLESANQKAKEITESKKGELSPEEFTNLTKSLLNLDEDNLSPILEKLTTKQLVRLYNGGGTIQREKILRALEPDVAAKLMSEIML